MTRLRTNWRHLFADWWRAQSPQQQDRVAMFAPLASVLLFVVMVIAAVMYLRTQESTRQHDVITQDLDFTQQQLRLRVLERREQINAFARDFTKGSRSEFDAQADFLLGSYPELHSLTWLALDKTIISNATSWYALSEGNTSQRLALTLNEGRQLNLPTSLYSFDVANQSKQAQFSAPIRLPDTPVWVELYVPIVQDSQVKSMIMARILLDNLLSYGVPYEINTQYAVSFQSLTQQHLAGDASLDESATAPWWHVWDWRDQLQTKRSALSPFDPYIQLSLKPYRASSSVVGTGVLALISILSGFTIWMLFGNWRHTRKRLRAQQQLVAEANFRRALENSMPTGLRSIDMQGRITYVNPAFCTMTGWTEAELVGQHAPYSFWPTVDHPTLMTVLKEQLAGRFPIGGIQMQVQRKDGSLFEARLYISPLIEPDGRQSGWLSSITDITEPIKVRNQLAASQERFTTVLEGLDAAVCVAPVGGDELLFANRQFRQWFARQSNGHLQLLQAGHQANTAHEDDDGQSDDLAGLPTDSMLSASSSHAEVFFEHLGPNGKWLELRTRYLNWVDGRLVQMVIATDISAQKQAEELQALQAERAQTSSRLITMGEMASSVAHELNQPLTAISNYCSGMVSRVQSGRINNEDLIIALEKTAHQAKRAGQIIGHIRSFVKRSEPKRQSTDISQIVAEVIELAQIELRRRRVTLSQHLAARMPRLHVDPILIEQVILNLLKNAAESIDASEQPIGNRHVELCVKPATIAGQDMIEFSVKDTGGGLPEEVMANLYQAFYTTKAQGMGIGLSLCRSIIESHQGRIEAQNLYNDEVVVGCRFTFWLPVAPVALFADAADAASTASTKAFLASEQA